MENKLTEKQKIEFSQNVGPGELYGLEHEITLTMLTIADLYRQQRYQEMGQMLQIKAQLLQAQAELRQNTTLEQLLLNLTTEQPPQPLGFKISPQK
jgi:hypothetical protein